MREKDLEKIWQSIEKEEAALLATSADNAVTMRTVSPVLHEGNILIFTHPESRKYKQLKANPNCCIAAANSFLTATAVFLGHTMLDENTGLREVYDKKFQGAFREDMVHGGRESEFILLKLLKAEGWIYENNIPRMFCYELETEK